MRDKHMKEKYLEVEKFPRAELTIQKVTLPLSLKQAGASLPGVPFQGILKLHGLEKPVFGTMTLKHDGDSSASVDAAFSLKLTDFGIQIPSFAGITIADQVEIKISAAALLEQ
jgi:polyisoprenoid-binding protein YceI